VASIEWDGYGALQQGLAAVAEVDATDLMEQWCDILVEGNRRGVLSGRDGNDQPMPPLKYRNGAGRKTRNRKAGDFGTSRYESTGAGPYATGLNDNLSTALYSQLTGPRLAPRGEASRVIKNLMTEVRHDPASGRWEAVAAWHQVVSAKGGPFLPFHFEGEGRNPHYALRPVRPQDYQFALNALRAWLKAQFFARL
jgi:hypothetical protein